MARWSRPIVLALSSILVVVLVALGLREPANGPVPDADPRNGEVFIQDNLWTTAGAQYAVLVAPDGTPYAARRPVGSDGWSRVDLAAIAGNPLDAPTAPDDHNVYAIGVDASGRVHVAGNMHTDPLRYIRSRSAGLGAWMPGPAPQPSDSVTYPTFVGLPDGTLLFWRRQGEAGEGRIVVDALRPGSARWRSLGTVLDGRPSGESPYLHHIAVDRSGTIHVMFEWRGSTAVESNTDVGYARSEDGGRTWERSDGTRLQLPITHASAETVIEAPPGSGLVNSGGMTVDAAGRPHGLVVFDRPGGEPVFEHVWLDRGQWEREELGDTFLDGRPALAGTPDGRVWMLGARGENLEAIDVTPGIERLETRTVARVPIGWEVNYDSQALARDGQVEMLIPDGGSPHVVVADLGEG